MILLKKFKVFFVALAALVLAACGSADSQPIEENKETEIVEEVPTDIEVPEDNLVDPEENKEENQNLAGNPEEDNQSFFDFSNIDTVDLDGNPVDGSIFTGKITLVNVWGTFCPPCIEELPDLGNLSRDYGDENFQVLGIVGDTYVDSDQNLEKARSIIADSKVDYVNIIPDQALTEELLVQLQFFPTSFVLDEDGRLLGSLELGAKDYDYFASLIESYK